MARSVIAATFSFNPMKSASSSTHSWPIMVEFHVGEQQLLAPILRRLDENIDRRGAEAKPQHRGGGAAIGRVGESAVVAIAMRGAGCERNVSGFAGRENDGRCRAGQALRGGGDDIGRQGLRAGRADQGGDMGHKDLNARNLSNS